jgi:hypothetical protein
VAIGVNALLTPGIELITELRRDAPIGSPDANYGIALGFIATLPSAR